MSLPALFVIAAKHREATAKLVTDGKHRKPGQTESAELSVAEEASVGNAESVEQRFQQRRGGSL